MKECECNPLGFLAQRIRHAEWPFDPDSVHRHNSKRTNLQSFAYGPEGRKTDSKPRFNGGDDAFGRVELHRNVQVLGLDAPFLKGHFDNPARPGAALPHDQPLLLQFLRLDEAPFAPFVSWRDHQDNLIFEEDLGSHISTHGRTFDESKRDLARHQRFQHLLRIAGGDIRPNLRVLLLECP